MHLLVTEFGRLEVTLCICSRQSLVALLEVTVHLLMTESGGLGVTSGFEGTLKSSSY